MKQILYICLSLALVACGKPSDTQTDNTSQKQSSTELEENNLVSYPGRDIRYSSKFCDLNAKHLQAANAIGLNPTPKDRQSAAHSKKHLREVKTGKNYIVDSLTHSVPYLVPAAAKRLDAIGEEFADILQRNNLPHYRFHVTSVLRTQEDIRSLQKSGNYNSVSNSAHCFGTTFDISYTSYDKVTRTHDYMTPENLKLVLGQVLLNQQREGHIYVKYEYKQACFHITTRN
ncbi:MAG: hypothetical protein J6T32_01755 [Paludibacteraceae bacterium]|nr:hypothetical protein [Paludibacteraceae bacterium]